VLLSRAAYKILGNTFPDLILDDQECFKTKEQWETLLALFPDHGPYACSTFGRSSQADLAASASHHE
jgi:hypothetical protein